MLSGVGMLARAEMRRRRSALVALALTSALGLGVSLGAFAAAYRTQHAYPGYVRRANVADLVVNPSLFTSDVDTALRTLPHVRHTWSDALLLAGIDDGRPKTAAQLLAEQSSGEVRGSSDGRYLDGDRMVVTAGRVPSGRHELFVTEDFRAQYEKAGHHIALGDIVPLSFLWPLSLQPQLGPPPKAPIKPISTARVRVVGFGRLSDEILDDDEFPRQRLVVSADLARKYDCLPPTPTRGGDIAAVFTALYPRTCATQYRYYALDVDDAHNIPGVEAEIARRFAALNKKLPAALTNNTLLYRPIVTTRADLDQRVQDSIRPTVVALGLFGVLAGLATIAIAALAVARRMRESDPLNETITALGLRRVQRVAAFSLPYGAVAIGGVVLACILAYLLSRIAPVGQVRHVVGHPSSSLPPAVTCAVVAGYLLLFALAVFTAARTATRRHVVSSRRALRAPLARSVERVADPAVGQGVRSATGTGRGARLLLAASCTTVAALTASVVFGTSLVALVDHPQRYGWPWDVGVLTNYGYGSLNTKLARAELSARHDIASYDELGFFSAQIKGKSIPVVFSGEGAPRVDLPVVHGRVPTTFSEVALGAATASQLGVGIGDRVDVDYGAGPSRFRASQRVVGTVVLPSVGQNLADRTGLGRGLFTVVPQKRIAASQSGSDLDYTFVGIKVRGTPADKVANALRRTVQAWDGSGQPPFVYATQIRPPEIRNAESIRNGPVLLAALLGMALLVALGLSIGASVNQRRRDLAVLRAMGFTRSQVRRSVRWQALTTIGIGVAVGLPVGIVFGRWGWRVFAEDLGIAPDATLPMLALLAIVAIVVAGALTAAVWPARRAEHLEPATTLHTL